MSRPKVWLDILTPKQVLFFTPIAKELMDRGCQILATSRKYREVGPMSKMCGLDLTFVGERGGENLVDQLEASTKRQLQVIPMVKEFRPTVAISVASGVCARVAYGFGVPHVAVNDSPHSHVAARLTLPLSRSLLCPWIIPYKEWAQFGVTREQITRYHALDPAVWLKRPPMNGPIPRLDRGKETITVRLEERYAPYMAGTDKDLTNRTLHHLAKEFPEANLVALCRYGKQQEEVEHVFGADFIVPRGIVDGRRLLEATDLFIGMGGTMTTEASLSGIPVISAFQGVLFTELYLESVGLLIKTKKPEEILRQARKLLIEKVRRDIARKAELVLNSMEDPVPKIVDVIMKS